MLGRRRTDGSPIDSAPIPRSANWRYNANHMSASGAWVDQSNPRSHLAKIVTNQIKADLFDSRGQLKLGRRHRADHWLFVLAVGLAVFGLVIIYSISSGLYGGDISVINREMAKRIGFLMFSIGAFFVASRVPLNTWRKWAPGIFLFGVLICLALPMLGALKMPIATCALGACRWYNLGVASFQPAELLKLGTVLFMAGYLSTRLAAGKLNNNVTLIEVIVVMAVSLGAIVGLQKDMGTGVALLAIFLIQLIMSGLKWRKLAIIFALMIASFAVMVVIAPHRMERVMTFTKSGNSESDYHINQAMIGLGSGGLLGRGLGQSVQAFGWLPEAVNDSIFAIIGETLGFVGAVGLLVAFAVLIMKMFKKTNYLNNMYLRLVVAGIVGWFASHVLANTMAMTHLIPLTGITLPLVSSGGTSMVFVMVGLGIVFEISRYTTHRQISASDEVETNTGGSNENTMRGRWQRRPRNTNHSSYQPAKVGKL